MKEKNKINQKIFLIRQNQTKFGGAELYLERVSKVLEDEKISYEIVNSIFPRFLPSWIKVILFNLQVYFFKKEKFYFALDRISCPDIYRAGDGVHKTFLSIEKKSKLNPLHPIYLYLEKKSFLKAKKIIAISEMVKKNIIDAYGIAQEKIDVIHNGIELKDFNYKASYEKIEQEFKINKKTFLILFVGSGFKRKGVKEFLEIISHLKDRDILAFVIGKDKGLNYYKNLADSLGVDNKVIFTGPRTDVDDFFAVSDIFLFPSHYEPFGSVILEAMNMKNAVFTTRQCGGGEALDNDFIMESPTDFSIIPKIENLLEDKDKLKQIKEKNRLKSMEFSIENNIKKTLKVINEVID